MSPTPFPVKPMLRLSQPGDVGRALRLAGRLGRQAGLSEGRLRDVTDIVTAMTIGLALDANGGWIGVRELSVSRGPGLEIVAFDGGGPAEEAIPQAGAWAERLRSELERLGGRGLSVTTWATAGGGTAVWAQVMELSAASPSMAPDGAVDVSGLLQAPPVDQATSGWIVQPSDGHLGIVVAEQQLQTLCRVAHGGDAPGTLERYRALLDSLPDVCAALIDIDLDRRVLSAVWSDGVVLAAGTDATPLATGGGTPIEGPVRELSVPWDHSLSLVVHTPGIRPSNAELIRSVEVHPALTCATLMRDHREPTPVACVVAARIRAGASTGPN